MPFTPEQSIESFSDRPRLFVARAIITLAGQMTDNGLLPSDAPVLVLRRNRYARTDANMLETPGGKLDGTVPRTTFDLMYALSRTAVREVAEETGLRTEEVTVPQVITERQMTGARAGTWHTTAAAIHEIRQGQIKLSSEHQEHVWLELGDAIEQADVRADSKAVFNAFLEPHFSKISH